MGHAAECSQYEVQCPRPYVLHSFQVTFGAAGAVSSVVSDAIGSAPTVTLGITGTYSIAGCPVMASVAGIVVTVQSLTQTVSYGTFSAIDASGITAVLKVYSPAGALTNPASGDIIRVMILGRLA